MSNIEIVQDTYAKFGSGDVAGLLGLLSDDVHWQTPEIENAHFGGKRRGREAVGEFFASLVADEEITSFEPLEFMADADKVVVLGTSASTVRETGKSYHTEWVHIFTVQEGKIVSFVEFFDNAAATRAFQKSTTV
jgi:ketosteroid isomerase-like protein